MEKLHWALSACSASQVLFTTPKCRPISNSVHKLTSRIRIRFTSDFVKSFRNYAEFECCRNSIFGGIGTKHLDKCVIPMWLVLSWIFEVRTTRCSILNRCVNVRTTRCSILNRCVNVTNWHLCSIVVALMFDMLDFLPVFPLLYQHLNSEMD
jgi:hypothetical protein